MLRATRPPPKVIEGSSPPFLSRGTGGGQGQAVIEFRLPPRSPPPAPLPQSPRGRPALCGPLRLRWSRAQANHAALDAIQAFTGPQIGAGAGEETLKSCVHNFCLCAGACQRVGSGEGHVCTVKGSTPFAWLCFKH